MMISSTEVIQLTILIGLATVLFYSVYSLPQVIGSVALLVMIPIQPVETRFATANVLLAYVIFAAMLMRRENLRLPLLPQFLLLLFCYLLSMSFVHKALYVQHGVYIFAMISAYMVMCVAYDLTFRFKDVSSVVNVFFAMNLIVIIYCAIQFAAGPNVKVVPFGIEEMTMIPAREDNRLVGPFSATGTTSEFLVIMIFLILHQFFYVQKNWQRYSLIALATANLLFLVATGNRGGFLTLVGGAALFIWMFRRELGMKRVAGLLVTGSILLAMTSAILINYSEFGELYTRLGDTTLEEGIPDTRQRTWPRAVAHIKESPILGHGPRYMMDGGDDGRKWPGWELSSYPHNLYLFLLSTVGMVGFVAFFIFFLSPLVGSWRAYQSTNVRSFETTFIKTSIVIMIVILVDQIKVEFIRMNLTDYWHFIYALLGLIVGATTRLRILDARERREQQQRLVGNQDSLPI
jgi:hypothetical protein